MTIIDVECWIFSKEPSQWKLKTIWDECKWLNLKKLRKKWNVFHYKGHTAMVLNEEEWYALQVCPLVKQEKRE